MNKSQKTGNLCTIDICTIVKLIYLNPFFMAKYIFSLKKICHYIIITVNINRSTGKMNIGLVAVAPQ